MRLSALSGEQGVQGTVSIEMYLFHSLIHPPFTEGHCGPGHTPGAGFYSGW